MDNDKINELARNLISGKLDHAEFFTQMMRLGTAPNVDANLDLDRQRRCGFPEVVYGEGKSADSLSQIFQRLLSDKLPVLATRVSQPKAQLLLQEFPEAIYNDAARTFRMGQFDSSDSGRKVMVITAGTSDRGIAEEACETLNWMNIRNELIQDIGVAGPQRLLSNLSQIRAADVAIVVAGMEGALPSVVGGHVDFPVIAVPTSVGYGASFDGIAALLGMLNSCAANVTVVNIDAGFKAGYIAGLIASSPHRNKKR